MTEFQTSKTYSTRSACDHGCIFVITIASRTAKTIKTDDGKTLRIGVRDGVEFVKPQGSYSMAPVIRADRMGA